MIDKVVFNTKDLDIECCSTGNYFSLVFGEEVTALSSAVLNGGYCRIRSFLNLRVDQNLMGRRKVFPVPGETISVEAALIELPVPVAGMMTSASMESFSVSSRKVGDTSAFCFLTSGIANALSAGDPAEYMPYQMFRTADSVRMGTINIAAGTNIRLTPAAMAEAVMLCTEAKASVLFDTECKSIVSGRQATGTGTDSLLIFSPADGGEAEHYCGKHTKLGQLLAETVREALLSSLNWK